MTTVEPNDTLNVAGELSLWTRAEGDAVVVTVRGEIDIASAPTLRDLLLGLIGDGCRKVIVDMCGVTFLDSSGLAALVAARTASRKHNSSLRLVGVAGGPAKVLEITGLSQVFRVWDTVEDALTM